MEQYPFDTTTLPAQQPRRPSRAPAALAVIAAVVVVALLATLVVLQVRANRRINDLSASLAAARTSASQQAGALRSSQAVQEKRIAALEKSTGALTSQITDAKRKIAQQEAALQQTITKLPADWQDIVKRTLPSVVQITCLPPAATTYETGTGFAVRLNSPPPAGYSTAILTNQHVVAACQKGSTDQVTVAKNGQTSPALLVADQRDWSTATDVALLYTAVSLPALPTSGVPAEGAEVGALGNPLDVTDVFTHGSVSKIWQEGWIQHTAALNPGNSGGPLLDAQGHVVGINTAGQNTTPDGQPVHDSYFSEPLTRACVVILNGCPFRG